MEPAAVVPADCEWGVCDLTAKGLPAVTPTISQQVDDNPDNPPITDKPTKLPELDNPSRVFNPIKLAEGLCSTFWSSQTSLTAFARKSLSRRPTCQAKRGSSNSLWPVPHPRWRWTAAQRLNPRRRRRRRYLHVRHQLLHIVISSLNWETLGFCSEPCSRAVLGSPLTVQQHEIIEHFEDMLDHFLNMSSFGADDLGRAGEKFQSIIHTLEELPQCRRLQDLEACALHVHSSFNSYATHFGNKTKADDGGDPNHCCAYDPSHAAANSQLAAAKPVQASRVKWDNPPSFDAAEFLGPVTKAAYQDPEVLRLDPSQWPPSKPGRMHCSRSEFLKLVERWDQLGACCLISVTEKDLDEACGIFCVPKDSSHDRLIINPKTINSRMTSVSEATKELAPGCMLTLLHLPRGKAFRFQADDLSDFYYTFRVPRARAKRNAFRLVLGWDEVKHLRCAEPHLEGSPVLVCLQTLAMGDSLAVELAQESHRNVLQRFCGSMIAHETLRYRHPVPRSDFIELLAIDDHVGIQQLDISEITSNPEKRDTQVFRDASVAYKSVGLVQHARKQQRNKTEGIILGADFDGVRGRVMAPRQRLLLLCIFSAYIARHGTCTPKLISIIVGCWIHVLMYRRPMFAILNHLFKEGRGLPSHKFFCLSRQACNELLLLAALGPIAQTDLKVKYATKIFCTDASPYGAAVIQSDITAEASKEIWRHSEQRGFHTRLESPVVELLREKGIEPETIMGPDNPVVRSKSLGCIPRTLQEGILFDCIEIFRGSGNWSKTHGDRGLRLHPGIELNNNSLRASDMADPAVFRELLALSLRRVIREWHAGVPCLSFGTLRRPQVRSLQCPAGFDPNEPFTAYHNMLARRTCFILTIALLSGCYISVEQPGSSRMFRLHCYRVLVQLGCVISHFAFCNFGSAFNKPSKWLHNKPWLIRLGGRCQCPWKGRHFVVQGTFTTESLKDFKSRCRPSCVSVYGVEPELGQAVSSYSGAYPLRLMQEMASGSIAASRGNVERIPEALRLEAYREVGLIAEDSVLPFSAEDCYPPRQWFEDPEWISELRCSLPFREMFRYRFKKPNHININESRTYKSLIKAISKSHRNSRFVALLDSRVTIGAAAKGRSSSMGITRILQGTLAYTLGANLYPGHLHCYSGDNRADAPSRGAEVEDPSRETPRWFEELSAGRPAAFDAVVEAAQIPKIAARWLRYLLLLGGDIERNPGPNRRGPMDMSVGFVKATSERMSRCFEGFRSWCLEVASINWSSLESDPQAVAWALRGYGLYLFENGHPRYLYTYAITASQEYLPSCRPFLSVAWQVDKKWQIHEPGTCRPVLPGLVVKASVCLAALCSWWNFLGLVLLGFGAMLHPAEMISLVRKDLIFPSDLFYDSTSLFVKIREPKTARFARRQHGRIDDPGIIAITEAIFGSLKLDEKLYPASISSFRKQWESVMTRLGVPCKQSVHGATPGVLRGSGATYLYATTEDIGWVAWRGRWSRVRTLEYYLQEVGAFMLIHELPPLAKTRISNLAKSSWAVIWALKLAAQNTGDGRATTAGGEI